MALLIQGEGAIVLNNVLNNASNWIGQPREGTELEYPHRLYVPVPGVVVELYKKYSTPSHDKSVKSLTRPRVTESLHFRSSKAYFSRASILRFR